jgi:hypothetical protein
MLGLVIDHPDYTMCIATESFLARGIRVTPGCDRGDVFQGVVGQPLHSIQWTDIATIKGTHQRVGSHTRGALRSSVEYITRSLGGEGQGSCKPESGVHHLPTDTPTLNPTLGYREESKPIGTEMLVLVFFASMGAPPAAPAPVGVTFGGHIEGGEICAGNPYKFLEHSSLTGGVMR